MRILMASDLSRRSQRAMMQAAILAARHGAELVVLHVGDAELPEELLGGELMAARQYLLRQFDHPLFEAVPAKRLLVRPGSDAQTIIEVADEVDADLVVLGEQRRRLLGIFSGTTVERVLRASTRTVLVVHGEGPHRYDHALAGVDLNGDASAILSATRWTCAQELSILHVSDDAARHRLILAGALPDAIAAHEDEVRRKLTAEIRRLAHGTQPEVLVEFGEALPMIRDVVARLRPDIVVVGKRPGNAVSRWVLGSVSEAVIADLPVDVLVVPLAPDQG